MQRGEGRKRGSFEIKHHELGGKKGEARSKKEIKGEGKF